MSRILTFQLVIHDPSGGKRLFEIPPGVSLIGRQAGVALVLEQQKISRHHAQIECDGQECFLTDLNSSNGTLLGGKKIQPQAPYHLAHGVIINIGDFKLVFEQAEVDLPGPPEEKPAGEASPTTPKTPEYEVPAEEAVPPPAEPPPPPVGEPAFADSPFLPGSSGQSRFLINFLPEIYHTAFMKRFLGIFEATLLPIEWNIDNFDLYLSPATAPPSFLPWLSSWFGLVFDSTWSDAQRRALLAEAHQIYAMRGTKWALSRLLEIYTGQKPAIEDTREDQEPFSFSVQLSGSQHKPKRKFIEQLIEGNKPAHTTFVLEFVE